MHAQRLARAIVLAFVWIPLFWARRRPKPGTERVTAVRMQSDAKHSMIAVSCQINGVGRDHACVIDSGATHTIISDKVLKPKGPLIEVTTTYGVIQVHQQDVSLRLANGLELKSRALVQPRMSPDDIEILIGQDVLRQFRTVILNYEKQTVEFHQ